MAALMIRHLALLLASCSVLTWAQEESWISAPAEEESWISAPAEEGAATEASTTSTTYKPSRKELNREEREQKEEDAKAKAVATAAASKKAQSVAQEALANFASYAQQLEVKSNDPAKVKKTAKEVSLQAESQVYKERATLEADYKNAVAALEEAVALGNKSHVLKKLARKADGFSDHILKLGKDKAKLERKAFSKMMKQAKKEVDQMGRAAEKAAHRGLKAAHQAEFAARKAHVDEALYEHHYDRAEETMQAVEGGAERLSDLAERVLEEFYGRVEHIVEDHAKAAKDSASDKAFERKEQIKTILKQTEAQETDETPTWTSFLAQNQGLPQPFAGGAVLGLVAFMALILFAVTLQAGSRQVALQRPILG